jgi:hypothetical protein
MAQNLATKYSDKVAERFSTTSKTKPGVNQDYDWQGSNAIKVYSVDTVTMGNYTRSGDNRYGNPSELGTTVQTLTLARDRSFTTTIDRRNRDESMGVTEAGKFLARQIREVITPEIDTYVLAALNTAADSNAKDDITTDAATTASNAYSNFLLLNDSLTDDLVPLQGRVAFLTSAYYSYLKLGGFVLDSDKGQSKLESGDLGMVDGVRLIVVPSSYMPSNTDLILTHPSVCVAPMLLTDYVIHDNPPGINGWLVEGRVTYDAFVLTAKIDGVAVHRTA